MSAALPQFITDILVKKLGPIRIMCSDADPGVSTMQAWAFVGVLLALAAVVGLATYIEKVRGPPVQ